MCVCVCVCVCVCDFRSNKRKNIHIEKKTFYQGNLSLSILFFFNT